jgi:hypothetical protein
VSILVGALPGVFVGAMLSSRAPDQVIRPILVVVLLASSLKLLGVGTQVVVTVIGAFVAVSALVWGRIALKRRAMAGIESATD